jgi:hypothetical protein
MTKTTRDSEGLTIQPVDSGKGRRILGRKRITREQLAHAIARYQAEERVTISILIGIHEQHGVFYTPDPDWNADAPDALDAPIGFIPWVQVYELLGQLPEGSTEAFLGNNGNVN